MLEATHRRLLELGLLRAARQFRIARSYEPYCGMETKSEALRKLLGFCGKNRMKCIRVFTEALRSVARAVDTPWAAMTNLESEIVNYLTLCVVS